MAGKKTGKRLLTWVLVLVMALSLLPLNALAEDVWSAKYDWIRIYLDDATKNDLEALNGTYKKVCIVSTEYLDGMRPCAPLSDYWWTENARKVTASDIESIDLAKVKAVGGGSSKISIPIHGNETYKVKVSEGYHEGLTEHDSYSYLRIDISKLTPEPPAPDEVTVTIKGNTDAKTYDGTEKTVTGYTFESSNPLYKDTDFTFNGTAEAKGTDVGNYEMGLKDSDFENTNTNFSNVKFVVTDGTLTINKRSVTLTSASDSKVYDGTPLTKPEVTVTGDGFVDGEVTDIRATGSVTNVSEGEVTNTIEYTTTDNFKADNYNITKNEGKLEVTPVTDEVTVTIKGNTDTKTYDGTEKTVTGYTFESSNPLYKDTDFTFNGTAEAKGIDVGNYEMGLKDSDFENKNTNFSNVKFVVTDGKLTINKCLILITAKGFTTVYNGKSPVVEDYTILRLDSNGEYVNGLPTGHKIDSYVTYGSGVDAGEYERFSMDKAKIVDAKDKDVTSNYDIGYENRTLTINKRSVTLTSASDSKVYDGTPLTKPEVTVTGDGFADGEGATYKVTGSQTEVGESANAFTYTLNNGTKESNYNIYKDEGKLEITPVTDKVTVTITGNTKTVRYNGKEQTVEGYTVSIDNKLYTADDFTFSGNAKATGTDADTYYMGLKDEQFTNNNNNFKNVKFVVTDGTLTITKAPTYTFDLSDLDTITVNKEFVSKYGRSATMSFEATATIEKEKAYIITDSGINTNVSNNGSAATAEPTYEKVVEAAGIVTLKTGKTGVFQFSGTYDLKPGNYRITVKETKGSDRYYVTYDDTTYTYDFIVNDKGEISIKTPITCTFTNVYTKRHTAAAPSKPTLNTGDHYAYVMGYPDGTVRPNGSITRAEVSAILFRLLSDKTRDEYFTTESSFTDVKAGAWYNNNIATLEKAGVIVDTAKGGAFRPNEAITRAELAAMLAQFSDAKPVKGVKFSDVSAEHWAYEAIAIAAKMGWIEGYPDGTFRPDATITRAEMMTLVNRALERVPSDEDYLLSKRVMLTFPDCKSGDWFYIAVQEATNSHTYERAATEKNGDEQWTALRANRDWTQLEK